MTPREQLLSLHKELSEEARSLMEKKNHDYASDQDPFANFRMFGLLGVVVRLGDKVSRLTSFLNQGKLEVDDERVLDTILDVVNYAVIFQGMYNQMTFGKISDGEDPEA